MANYFDLIQKRIADPATGPAVTVDLLVDHEQHQPLREAWGKAQLDVEAARKRVALAAETSSSEGPKRRMNQPSPLTQAETELEAAQEAEKQARDAVKACFVRIHLAAPSAPMMAEVAAQAGSDQVRLYDLLTRRCVIRVTDETGGDLPELTADMIADYLAVAPVGERLKASKALDQASTPVDLPT
ncbi:hypothetical protein [Arachnia propionica]|uniref:hypothetical protein n=1 Tax=Arachnia propionica TaxID=1750 RepID=UPI003C6F89BD